MRVLFVTWDGPQVSYLESLFLPIFVGLQQHGIHFDVLQFGWDDGGRRGTAEERCRAAGLKYRKVAVLRRLGGVGAFLSGFAGARAVRAAARTWGSQVIMPRSLMPALATLSARGLDLPVIFDADGLPADERVDFAGLPPTGLVYRALRDIEAQMIRRSARVIVRSTAAADILHARAGPPVGRDRFHVVRNGRDATVFEPGDAEQRRQTRASLAIDERAPLLVYAGSIGPQYRMDLVARVIADLRRIQPEAQLLVLTPAEREAWAALSAAGAPIDALTICHAEPDAVARYLACADVGLAFRTRCFSMQGVAPIKLSEYLLCGLPVIGTAGVGNTTAAMAAGVFLDDKHGPVGAAGWVTDSVTARRDQYRFRARDVGLSSFSLDRSIADYRAVLTGVSSQTHH